MRRRIDKKHTFVSSSLLKMSSILDRKGRQVFRGTFDPENDYSGVLIFIDFFPNEPFPHLSRYVFVRDNGQPEIVDSIHEPSLDIQFTSM